MERDDLSILLRRADEAAGAPQPASNLAARVRRRRARRRNVIGVAGALPVMLIIGLGVWLLSDRPDATVQHEISPLVAREDLDELQREGDVHSAAVDLFLERRGRQPRRVAPPRLDPLMELQWQREQAALVLVRQGDRLAEDLNLPQHAAVAYQQARDIFPGTRWATIAQDRLAAAN